MTIRRAPRPETRFYTVSKEISEDLRLSWAARGLLIFLLGKPDHWEVSVAHLITQTANAGKRSSRDAVRVILKELESVGYLQADKARNESGKFGGMAYTVCETPIIPISPETDFPAPAKPAPDSPETDFPAPAKPAPDSPETDYPAPENPPLASNELLARTETATNGSPGGSQGDLLDQAASPSDSASESQSFSSNVSGNDSDATRTDSSTSPKNQASLSGGDDAVASEPKKTGKAKATKGSGVDIGILTVPGWLPVESLQAFVDHRKEIKKPLTQRAAELLIRELDKIRQAGYDPLDEMNKSILSGWSGVYMPSGSRTFPGIKKFDPREHINGSRNEGYGHGKDDDFIDVAPIRVD